jgi:hypothetical protein
VHLYVCKCIIIAHCAQGSQYFFIILLCIFCKPFCKTKLLILCPFMSVNTSSSSLLIVLEAYKILLDSFRYFLHKPLCPPHSLKNFFLIRLSLNTYMLIIYSNEFSVSYYHDFVLSTNNIPYVFLSSYYYFMVYLWFFFEVPFCQGFVIVSFGKIFSTSMWKTINKYEQNEIIELWWFLKPSSSFHLSSAMKQNLDLTWLVNALSWNYLSTIHCNI